MTIVGEKNFHTFRWTMTVGTSAGYSPEARERMPEQELASLFQRIAAEQQGNQSDNDEAAEAEAAGFAQCHASSVIDIGTLSSSVQLHSLKIFIKIRIFAKKTVTFNH